VGIAIDKKLIKSRDLWPEQNMVVVTGGNYNERSPADELEVKYILPAVGL
jgi:hypothetical protein